MPKFIEMKFKITNSGTINFIKLYKNEKDNYIPAWIKCGHSGKAIVWENPIEKGIGTYNKAVIELSTAQITAVPGKKAFVPSAKILYSKDILSNKIGAIGSFIEDGNTWTAEYMGSKELEISAFLQVMSAAA